MLPHRNGYKFGVVFRMFWPRALVLQVGFVDTAGRMIDKMLLTGV